MLWAAARRSALLTRLLERRWRTNGVVLPSCDFERCGSFRRGSAPWEDLFLPDSPRRLVDDDTTDRLATLRSSLPERDREGILPVKDCRVTVDKDLCNLEGVGSSL